MRNPDRIQSVLNEIKKVWLKYPDLRLGQLILNVENQTNLYYVEDDRLIELLKSIYNR